MQQKIRKMGENTGGFFSEFWKFAARGNVLDLAIGLVIGTAFTAIVNSLVTDIITPFLSLISDNVDLTRWHYTLRPPINVGADESAAVIINYGHLMQVVMNFILIALCVFIFLELLAKLRKRLDRSEKAAPPDPVSTQEKLLSEIRDLLKEQRRPKTTSSITQNNL